MGWLLLIAGALIALVFAWLVSSLINLMSGDRVANVGSSWWDIFSKMWSRESSYAEPLPDLVKSRRFAVGDRVRVVGVPSNADHSVSPERQVLLERCVGKVYRVERIDAFGSIELHVLDDGSQAPGGYHNIVFIDPQYLEPVAHRVPTEPEI